MSRTAALVIAAALALSGCDIGGGDEEPPALREVRPPADHRDRARPAPERGLPGASASDGEVIRGWLEALNAGRYERAASYFAPGAVVEQIVEFTLDDRAEAIEFNRSLPCRGDLTDVDDEGDTSLAAFRLRPGRGGRCPEGGSARVRFRIRAGRIREWRQLPEPVAPGEST